MEKDLLKKTVETIILSLSLKEKCDIANLTKENLPSLHRIYGKKFIRDFGLNGQNPQLIQSCIEHLGYQTKNIDHFLSIIFLKLWEELRKGYRLRLM